MSRVAAVVLLSFFTFVASAQATSYAPQIDFRDGALWSGADHQTSFSGSQAGVDLTIRPTASSAALWWDQADGLGIRLSYEDDEVESPEILAVYFDHAVELTAIYISDLFFEDGYFEMGSYRIDGGAWMDFDADILPGSNSNGERLIFFGTPIDHVHLVEFTAPGKIFDQNHEFALMGFDARPVPEPSTALLLGGGLLMFAARARLS
jgi:hypothetical protein